MEPKNLRNAVESLVFASDGPLELSRLQRILEIERDELEQAIAALAEEYAERGIRLQRHGDSLQMVSAPETTPYLEKLLGVQQSVRLSRAALETLAIVAYHQPITRPAIETVRGVNCDRALSALQARGLIREVGRLETAGRPILFGTTFEFLQYFGLESLDQLPPLEDGATSIPGGASTNS
ncbi:MAG: SMC-Scp complex subunit ScpB [Chloroflexi bacterium]|nr:SMC-Scp complex subunit ScpB [Chloroflexota bacterium]MDA8187727.1 SMC-Scp complex subunit ScpB [Dehalococcoidales bacterium]